MRNTIKNILPLFILPIFISASALAANTMWTENTLTHMKLTTVHSLVHDFSKNSVLGTCGLVMSGTAKQTPSDWEAFIGRVLNRKHINQVLVNSYHATKSNIRTSIEDLVHPSYDYTVELQTSLNALGGLIEYATLVDSNIELFNGSVEGDFIFTMRFIALVDHAKNEFVIFGEGDCE